MKLSQAIGCQQHVYNSGDDIEPILIETTDNIQIGGNYMHNKVYMAQVFVTKGSSRVGPRLLPVAPGALLGVSPEGFNCKNHIYRH